MSQDFLQSVYRERLLKHVLIGELLKHAWLNHGAELEVSQPAVDRAGHDVVLEAKGTVRHVQLKSSSLSATTRSQAIHLQLANKPSGCVIWMKFNPIDMRIDHFMFFGGDPDKPLPNLFGFETSKHTRADANGVKKERPNLRIVPVSSFRSIGSVDALYKAHFGSAT
ncbi:MAG TPA: hypothetical protein VJ698_14100 [Noviherbaspirillum sp.]|uniref:hypothetical protein n=1 Tax=Noviherbaspirillum sp. TaxID=1926288 RepID=UPI002B4A0435|nr:hypothetical protein [Noviherbaspirillum sp.]HJV86599.1 hypothetical protein [Noviherbaspirillum sp.]